MKNRYLVILLVAISWISCKSSQNYVYVADVDTDYIRVNKYAAAEDKKINELIAPYKVQLDAEMNEVLGVLTDELVKSKPNSNMGNWFADILQATAETITSSEIDFALQNYGGLRVPSVAVGDLTVGNIFELMPFDNKLVVMELDGATTQKLLDRIADYGGWPISNNLRFSISSSKAINIIIKGEEFDVAHTYRVALPDYVANGGDHCSFLKELPQINTEKYIREVVIEYLRIQGKDKEITAPTAHRIK